MQEYRQVVVIRNKCTECKHKWRDQPGAFSIAQQRCPQCGSRYFKWSDYSLAKKKYSGDYDFGTY